MVERILNLMKLNNVSATQLTTALEISSSSISEWKKGKAKPSTEAIIKLSNFFKVSCDYLLIGEESNFKIECTSSDEIEMLNLFNQLSERKRVKEIGRLELLVEQAKEAKNKEAI